MSNIFAVINGATGGMGSEIACQLAEKYNLILLGRDELKLIELSKKIRIKNKGIIIKCYAADMLDNAAFDSAVNSLKHDCVVKALVNCVGVVPIGGVLDVPEKEWEKTFNISFMSAVRLVKAFVPFMKEDGGSIVLINGVLAIQPDPNFVVSAAMTAALRNFAKAISKDLVQYRIRVNSVLPGATKTKLWDNIAIELGKKLNVPAEELSNNVAESNPQKRFATPIEIAHAVKFLCSAEASYINGICMTIDGGASSAM